MSAGPTTRNRRPPDPAGHRPDPGREDGQEDARRQPGQRCPEGGVAEHALQEQRLEAERDVERAVHQQGREVDDREVARPEQAERDERIGSPGHEDREGDRADDPDAERDESERVVPLLVLAADGPEGQAADRERHDHRAQPVEPAGRLFVARLLHVHAASRRARSG